MPNTPPPIPEEELLISLNETPAKKSPERNATDKKKKTGPVLANEPQTRESQSFAVAGPGLVTEQHVMDALERQKARLERNIQKLENDPAHNLDKNKYDANYNKRIDAMILADRAQLQEIIARMNEQEKIVEGKIIATIDAVNRLEETFWDLRYDIASNRAKLEKLQESGAPESEQAACRRKIAELSSRNKTLTRQFDRLQQELELAGIDETEQKRYEALQEMKQMSEQLTQNENLDAAIKAFGSSNIEEPDAIIDRFITPDKKARQAALNHVFGVLDTLEQNVRTAKNAVTKEKKRGGLLGRIKGLFKESEAEQKLAAAEEAFKTYKKGMEKASIYSRGEIDPEVKLKMHGMVDRNRSRVETKVSPSAGEGAMNKDRN